MIFQKKKNGHCHTDSTKFSPYIYLVKDLNIQLHVYKIHKKTSFISEIAN